MAACARWHDLARAARHLTTIVRRRAAAFATVALVDGIAAAILLKTGGAAAPRAALTALGAIAGLQLESAHKGGGLRAAAVHRVASR